MQVALVQLSRGEGIDLGNFYMYLFVFENNCKPWWVTWWHCGFSFVMDALKFIRSINKALNFPAFWENEVLLNTLFYYFHLFIYKLVISWRDVTHSNSIIRINIKRSDSLNACTYGGLYYSRESLSMGFTLPCTRLVWWSSRVSILLKTKTSYNSHHLNQSALYEFYWFLELQDVTLLESLSNYIHYNTTMRSPQEAHGIMSNSYHIHVLTPNPHLILQHYNLMPLHNQPINS